METKHTKAPWGWQNFGNGYDLIAQHGNREVIIGATKNPQSGFPMAAMRNDGRLQMINPEHPNAKLIAAAPEVLEALIECLEGVKELNGEYQEGWDEVIFKAESAIKKATE